MRKTLQSNTQQPGRPILPTHVVDLNFPKLLQQRNFSFQTFAQANNLAAYLASLVPDQIKARMELGLNEIFFNAIEHGNLGISFAEKASLKEEDRWQHEVNRRAMTPANAHKTVQVEFSIEPSQITITVRDQGQGFDPESTCFKNPANFAQNGRGLTIAKNHCFDSLYFSNKGSTVHCVIYRPWDHT